MGWATPLSYSKCLGWENYLKLSNTFSDQEAPLYKVTDEQHRSCSMQRCFFLFFPAKDGKKDDAVAPWHSERMYSLLYLLPLATARHFPSPLTERNSVCLKVSIRAEKLNLINTPTEGKRQGWMRPWASWSSCGVPAHCRGVGLGGPQRSLPTLRILWSYENLNVSLAINTQRMYS